MRQIDYRHFIEIFFLFQHFSSFWSSIPSHADAVFYDIIYAGLMQCRETHGTWQSARCIALFFSPILIFSHWKIYLKLTMIKLSFSMDIGASVVCWIVTLKKERILKMSKKIIEAFFFLIEFIHFSHCQYNKLPEQQQQHKIIKPSHFNCLLNFNF